jgi:hypothetical protein
MSAQDGCTKNPPPRSVGRLCWYLAATVLALPAVVVAGAAIVLAASVFVAGLAALIAAATEPANGPTPAPLPTIESRDDDESYLGIGG